MIELYNAIEDATNVKSVEFRKISNDWIIRFYLGDVVTGVKTQDLIETLKSI